MTQSNEEAEERERERVEEAATGIRQGIWLPGGEASGMRESRLK